jgi:hypothetical protein
VPTPNYGPVISVDGPAPSPPALTLLGAARDVTPDSGDGQPADRWINGAELWPYPRDLPDVFDPCQSASSAGHAKDAGTTPTTPETFGAYNVLEGVTCTTRSTHADPAEWQRRAEVALNAYQHWAIEKEFWAAALLPANPHLAQTTGLTFDNSATTTSVKNAIALLEQAIADKGGNGVIHLRPAVFSQLTQEGGGSLMTVTNGVAKTYLGTTVVPGVGYVGSNKDGTAPSGTLEWAYATGPVEYRMSGVQLLPPTIAEATDRTQNLTTFRAERYVMVTWDQRIHAVVKIDRAFTTFTS